MVEIRTRICHLPRSAVDLQMRKGCLLDFVQRVQVGMNCSEALYLVYQRVSSAFYHPLRIGLRCLILLVKDCQNFATGYQRT